MRIVHVTNYQVPGYGYEEILLSKAQAKLGHDVSILTGNYLHPPRLYAVLSKRFPDRQVPPRTDKDEGVRIERLPAFEVARRVWIRGLEKRLLALHPDVVHCHNLLQFHPVRTAIVKMFRRERFALVVDDHMHTSVIRSGHLSSAFYALERAILQPLLAPHVDRFAAISEDTRAYLRERCGVHGTIALMPLGTDTETFRASPELRLEWRARLGYRESVPVYVYTGKIIPEKGPHLLAEAALSLLKQGVEVSVLMVGDASQSYLESIEATVATAGYPEAFCFLPSVSQSELAGAYACADAAVWPRQESMAILEAMASSLPVIVRERSGYSSVIASGAGLTFRDDDMSSLAAAMHVLRDPSVRMTLGSAGRGIAENTYSWKRRAESYIALYERALADA